MSQIFGSRGGQNSPSMHVPLSFSLHMKINGCKDIFLLKIYKLLHGHNGHAKAYHNYSVKKSSFMKPSIHDSDKKKGF